MAITTINVMRIKMTKIDERICRALGCLSFCDTPCGAYIAGKRAWDAKHDTLDLIVKECNKHIDKYGLCYCGGCKMLSNLS